jgi:hypothetical protein
MKAARKVGRIEVKIGSREFDEKEWSQFPKVKHAVGTPGCQSP